MIKIISKVFFLLFVISFMGCDLISIKAFDKDLQAKKQIVYAEKACGQTLYNFEPGFARMTMPSDISIWILTNIKFKKETIDKWEGPTEAKERGTGDSEEFAFLTMNIAYKIFGIEYDFVLIDTDGDGLEDQASVALGDTVYDVWYIGNTLDTKPLFRFPFKDVFPEIDQGDQLAFNE